jgi:hypothetical protein
MPKKSDSLTGGTKDVNPQFLVATASVQLNDTTNASASANATVKIPNPVPRFGAQGEKSVVLEVLKIFWDADLIWDVNSGIANVWTLQSFLSTSDPGGIPVFGSTKVLDYIDGRLAYDNTSTAITEYLYVVILEYLVHSYRITAQTCRTSSSTT